ncbi:SDR family oxidoreductase [Clostridium sp. 'White wine YQ']|uniref:SDR family oxidoreductase n=1 Tax=Clostridium sp. 'White wine YQ' TaxID=3027474 RepID=UPI002366EE41|nr:SDR family oxidoreductase [Clostridium sp. 'White wine YQ']MDD7793164.1 SDR family NAD(P)-dependent oxidoreductase [Clostridium sp. 'White wine YQ']
MGTVIITGGNDGIGYYMVERFLSDGKNVAVLDIELNKITELMKQYPDSLVGFQCDIRDVVKLKSCLNEVVKKFKTIDYAIHNACMCIFKSLEELSYEEYNEVFQVNFYGAINLTKEVLPYMKKQKNGKIFFTSSGVGVTGFTNISSYASSKGAIESFAKCMNIEYESSGISFHILHPPLTRTKSSEPLPVPKEFKADACKVGNGLAKNIDKNKFIICHSFSQALQTKVAYLFPLYVGRMMAKMTSRAKVKE